MPKPSKPSNSAKPLVLVPACNRMMGEHPFHMAGQKYIEAIRLAGCLPLIVPPVTADELDALLAMAHGVLLTGSQSNVHPSHFGEAVHDESLPLDVARDDWTLPLIPKALALGMPLFAICRGFQEVNVALGGSLHQAVQEQPGFADHRGAGGPPELHYAVAHPVQIHPGGLLAALLGQADIEVNSSHGQGVKMLAPGLRIEATAPDGIVEAFSADDTEGFNLSLQWHPEWRAASNPISTALFQAFGQACTDYQGRHPKT